MGRGDWRDPKEFRPPKKCMRTCTQSAHGEWDPRTNPARAHVFAFRFAGLLARSLARRAAVRVRAAASDAFLARAVRSAFVMFAAAFLPPCLPNSRPSARIAARTSGGILMLMDTWYT